MFFLQFSWNELYKLRENNSDGKGLIIILWGNSGSYDSSVLQ